VVHPIIPTHRLRLFTYALFGVLASLGLFAYQQERWVVAASVAGALVFVGAWHAWLHLSGRPLVVEGNIRPVHYLQLICHSSIYGYWSFYWDGVGAHVPMLLAQICFAYLFDIALLWTKRGSFRWGFGNIPIVLSTNLFIWFKDDWFYWQFPLIALAFFGKEMIQWTRDGIRGHIFNPSGFTLGVFSVVLLVTGTASTTYGMEIASTLGRAPHMYVWIFLLGLIVQTNFPVVLMTGTAAIAIYGMTWLHTQTTGLYLFVDTTIPIAVFLGMTFLFTDPATSPRSSAGKILFGLIYGVLVVLEYQWLMHLGTPTIDSPGENLTYFDKLLQVPVLNLLVPVFDRVGRKINLERFDFSLDRLPVRIGATAAWCGLFGVMLPSLAYYHPGRNVGFWEEKCFPGEPKDGKTWRERFPNGNEEACRSLAVMYVDPCELGDPAACYGLGNLNLEGAGMPVREVNGMHLYERACEKGYAPACTELGNMLVTREAKADQDAAVKLFALGCDLAEGDACRNLATSYARGIGVEADMDRAFKELERARAAYDAGCKDKSKPATIADNCARLADVDKMLQGRGAPPGQPAAPPTAPFNPADLAAMMRAAGMPQMPANATLPGMPALPPGALASLPGMNPDEGVPAAVLMQMKVGCDAGEGQSCVTLAQALMRRANASPQDHATAAGYVSRACELGVARGCGLLGIHYRNALGVPKDDARALALFQKACKGGDTEACSVR
jgi:TPR repeat protein